MTNQKQNKLGIALKGAAGPLDVVLCKICRIDEYTSIDDIASAYTGLLNTCIKVSGQTKFGIRSHHSSVYGHFLCVHDSIGALSAAQQALKECARLGVYLSIGITRGRLEEVEDLGMKNVIGHAINLAARLSSMSHKEGRIIVAPEVYRSVVQTKEYEKKFSGPFHGKVKKTEFDYHVLRQTKLVYGKLPTPPRCKIHEVQVVVYDLAGFSGQSPDEQWRTVALLRRKVIEVLMALGSARVHHNRLWHSPAGDGGVLVFSGADGGGDTADLFAQHLLKSCHSQLRIRVGIAVGLIVLLPSGVPVGPAILRADKLCSYPQTWQVSADRRFWNERSSAQQSEWVKRDKPNDPDVVFLHPRLGDEGRWNKPPQKPSPFVNRKQELQGVVEDLENGKVVHIKGNSAIGKTALAIVVALQMESLYPEDVVFLCFMGRTIDDLFDAISIRLTGRSLQCSHQEKSTIIHEMLSRNDRKVVVVLDNIEQSQKAEISEFISLRSTTPVLLTSRIEEGLRFAGESEYQLQELSLNDRRQLLNQGAGRAISERESRTISDQATGLPQVLTLVAYCLKGSDARTEKELLDWISQQLLSELGPEDRVTAIVDHVFKQLTPPQQALFILFGLFGGDTFSLEAIREISHDSQVEEYLRTLFLPSTLIKEHGNDRFYMHPLIKSYAETQLRKNPPEHAFARMISYYLHFVKRITDRDVLKAEKGNILSAIHLAEKHSRHAEVIEFVGVLNGHDAYYGFFGKNGLWREGIQVTSLGEKAASAAGSRKLQAIFVRDIGQFSYWLGDHKSARQHCKQARLIFQSLKEDLEVIRTSHILGYIEDDEGVYSAARKLYQESLVQAKRLKNDEMIALGHHLVGVIDYHEKKYRRAEVNFTQCLSILKRLVRSAGSEQDREHYRSMEARCKRRFAALARMQAHYASRKEKAVFLTRAMSLIQWSLERETGDRSRARALRQKGMIHYEKAELEEAAACYRESLDIFIVIGNLRGVGAVKYNLACVAASRNEFEDAQRLCIESREIAQKVNSHYGEALALRQLGQIALKQDDLKAALKHLRLSYALLKTINSPFAGEVAELVKRSGQ